MSEQAAAFGGESPASLLSSSEPNEAPRGSATRAYLTHLAKRLGQFLLVVVIGINIAYLITHATPIDPVEQSIAAVTTYGSTTPEAIDKMRQSLRELYGLEGSPLQQYASFWRRVLTGDFGPSLSAFPTPVSTLIGRALPWTIGLLLTSTLISFALGTYLGGLAGYYRDSPLLKATGILAMALHPMPYYIVALILLIVFGYLFPVLPISGGAGMHIERGFSLAYGASVLRHAALPVASLVLVQTGSWFLGMRSLASNIVTEDYVAFAEIGGVAPARILKSYVIRNALSPQFTGLALTLGSIFNGAVITEKVFGYPGIGTLLIDAVYAGDYSLVLGVTTVSIVAVSACVLIIDLLYPLIDPRIGAS